jgi:hypothetical protein
MENESKTAVSGVSIANSKTGVAGAEDGST